MDNSQAAAEPADAGADAAPKAGRNLPAAIAVGVILAGLVLLSRLMARRTLALSTSLAQLAASQAELRASQAQLHLALEAALRGVGGVCAAVDLVIAGGAANAFVA